MAVCSCCCMPKSPTTLQTKSGNELVPARILPRIHSICWCRGCAGLVQSNCRMLGLRTVISSASAARIFVHVSRPHQQFLQANTWTAPRSCGCHACMVALSGTGQLQWCEGTGPRRYRHGEGADKRAGSSDRQPAGAREHLPPGEPAGVCHCGCLGRPAWLLRVGQPHAHRFWRIPGVTGRHNPLIPLGTQVHLPTAARSCWIWMPYVYRAAISAEHTVCWL